MVYSFHMWQVIKKVIISWIKLQFRGNPLVENTNEYVGKFASALQVGMIGAVSVMSIAFIGSFIFIIGALRGWF